MKGYAFYFVLSLEMCLLEFMYFVHTVAQYLKWRDFMAIVNLEINR